MYRENLITGSWVLTVLGNRAILFNRAVVDVVESSWSQAQSCWAKQGRSPCCLCESGMELAMQNWSLWLRCSSWGAWQDPFFWERKTLITLTAVMPRHLIVSTLVNEAKNNFCCCFLFGVLLKGWGAGRASQFCTKPSLLMLSSLVIASALSCGTDSWRWRSR